MPKVTNVANSICGVQGKKKKKVYQLNLKFYQLNKKLYHFKLLCHINYEYPEVTCEGREKTRQRRGEHQYGQMLRGHGAHSLFSPLYNVAVVKFNLYKEGNILVLAYSSRG